MATEHRTDIRLRRGLTFDEAKWFFKQKYSRMVSWGYRLEKYNPRTGEGIAKKEFHS